MGRMSYAEWLTIHSFTEDESERVSMDNHIIHYGLLHFNSWDDELEIDEDLESNSITIKFIKRVMHNRIKE